MFLLCSVAISQPCFSLTSNQHQPPGTSQSSVFFFHNKSALATNHCQRNKIFVYLKIVNQMSCLEIISQLVAVTFACDVRWLAHHGITVAASSQALRARLWPAVTVACSTPPGRQGEGGRRQQPASGLVWRPARSRVTQAFSTRCVAGPPGSGAE